MQMKDRNGKERKENRRKGKEIKWEGKERKWKERKGKERKKRKEMERKERNGKGSRRTHKDGWAKHSINFVFVSLSVSNLSYSFKIH